MKIIKHITKEGSFKHMMWWNTKGRHCSESNCEVNHPEKEIIVIEDKQNL